VIQPTPITQSQQLQTDGFCITCGTPRIVGAAFCASCGANLSSIQLADLHPRPNSDVKIGSLIDFGAYKWRVINTKGNQVLIITEDIIEKRAYNAEFTATTWEKCDLRKYLNCEFLSTLDSSKIALTTNISTPTINGMAQVAVTTRRIKFSCSALRNFVGLLILATAGLTFKRKIAQVLIIILAILTTRKE
jgi:hypothetical protein